MSDTAKKIDLNQEIELRKRINEQYDSLARALTVGGLSVIDSADVEALALLLWETTESRKSAEKHEKALKAELKRHFAPGTVVLDLTSVIAMIDKRGRTDLDKDALLRDFGQDFLDKYAKRTEYEMLTVKKKGG